jgi:hypothetical protein
MKRGTRVMAMWGYLLGALTGIGIAWFFKEWYPIISTRAKETKIKQITNLLKEYDKDFADIKLFIIRIVRISCFGLGSLIVSLVILQITISSMNSQIIICKLGADACSEARITSFVFRGLNFLFAFWVALVARRVSLELRPDKYRSYMNDRIESLRSRLKTG